MTKILQAYPASDLKPADADIIRTIRMDHPWLPAEYLEFLQGVGWGNLGNSRFMFYQGPVPFAEIFDAPHPAGDILLIGDNFAGYHLGYHREASGNRLVAFDHCFPEGVDKEDSLESFVRTELAVGVG